MLVWKYKSQQFTKQLVIHFERWHRRRRHRRFDLKENYAYKMNTGNRKWMYCECATMDLYLCAIAGALRHIHTHTHSLTPIQLRRAIAAAIKSTTRIQ